jgi:sugar-specific transcriptional regulator TrmB/DNA-binding CsgD family transcriptional regulator
MWETVGIPETEARVYEALISRGQSTADVLSSRVNMTTARTTRALANLIQRGLVTRAPGRPARYTAVEPSLAGSVLIAKREHELRRLQQHLNKLDEAFHAEKSANRLTDDIEIIKGAPSIWRTFIRVQRHAQQEIRAFDKPPYFVAAGEHGDEGPNLEERRSLATRTVTYRVVYDQESLAIPGRLENIWEGIKHGERAKIGTTLPVKLVLSDNTLAILSSPTDYHNSTAYLIHPSSLLDMTAALFETTWTQALPISKTTTTGNQNTTNPRQRQLLTLLASGATDEVIARTFGWSIRTVQRHIHQLMQQTGTRTRFQIGMEAVRRSWL